MISGVGESDLRYYGAKNLNRYAPAAAGDNGDCPCYVVHMPPPIANGSARRQLRLLAAWDRPPGWA